jgi:hypothetical protein
MRRTDLTAKKLRRLVGCCEENKLANRKRPQAADVIGAAYAADGGAAPVATMKSAELFQHTGILELLA